MPRYVVGWMLQGDRPDWRPLSRVVGENVMGDFMWMFEVELAGGGRLQAYKHVETRRYLHLNDDGRAFAYVDDERYREIPVSTALELVLRPLWERSA